MHTAAPAHVLVLGMGYSGRHLAALLQAQGIACSGTVRDPVTAPDDGLTRYRLAEGVPVDEELRAAIRRADAIVCSVPPEETGDPALRLLADALHDSPALRWVAYLSSTAVYADRDGGWVDEQARADADDATALRRLRAEQQWRAFAQARGIASAVFRLPALYGRGRNALVQLAQGKARHVVRPGLVFNRLHVEDLAAAVLAAMQRPQGHALYLPADDEPAPPQDVLAHAALLSGLPLPAAQAWDDPAVPASLRRFYASNKRIDSRGTRAALQWQPRFATYRDGLADAWANGDGRR
ncbi:NAD-dependent epimerase/dehydratase family protein [Stenotrophomonas rhizophila]|uniref:NAD-dependent epimerase/dehydratase family protein n=1 Tax=Stenotrophomonas rhizophila TaxID=216778 RepID=UPI0028D80978|nr:NAD-dependent epimerase/dehydratase family protein [Stenotrophomonas rhizophila]